MSYGIFFGVILFSSLITYLVIVNNVATKGVEISVLEKRITSLEETLKEQTLKEAQLRTLTHVNENDALAAVNDDDVRVVTLTHGDVENEQQQEEKLVVAVAEYNKR